jgi:hypothetical protein
MAIEATTPDLVARLAKMGTRLDGSATALEGIGVVGGIFVFVVGLVVGFHSRRNPAGATSHPYVAIGIAICIAACLITAFMVVLSRVVEVFGEYVSTAHLVGVSEP